MQYYKVLRRCISSHLHHVDEESHNFLPEKEDDLLNVSEKFLEHCLKHIEEGGYDIAFKILERLSFMTNSSEFSCSFPIASAIHFSTSRLTAMGSFYQGYYLEAASRLQNDVADCPIIRGHPVPGMVDSLLLLSEAYTAMERHEEALRSARLAVEIAHTRLDVVKRFMESGDDLSSSGLHGQQRPAELELRIGPILDAFTAVSFSYYTLARKLDKANLGEIALEWYERAHTSATKFNIDPLTAHEFWEALGKSKKLWVQPPSVHDPSRKVERAKKSDQKQHHASIMSSTGPGPFNSHEVNHTQKPTKDDRVSSSQRTVIDDFMSEIKKSDSREYNNKIDKSEAHTDTHSASGRITRPKSAHSKLGGGYQDVSPTHHNTRTGYDYSPEADVHPSREMRDDVYVTGITRDRVNGARSPLKSFQQELDMAFEEDLIEMDLLQKKLGAELARTHLDIKDMTSNTGPPDVMICRSKPESDLELVSTPTANQKQVFVDPALSSVDIGAEVEVFCPHVDPSSIVHDDDDDVDEDASYDTPEFHHDPSISPKYAEISEKGWFIGKVTGFFDDSGMIVYVQGLGSVRTTKFGGYFRLHVLPVEADADGTTHSPSSKLDTVRGHPMGLRVSANYQASRFRHLQTHVSGEKGSSQWIPGRILSKNKDGTYCVGYDFGETESNVRYEDIRDTRTNTSTCYPKQRANSISTSARDTGTCTPSKANNLRREFAFQMEASVKKIGAILTGPEAIGRNSRKHEAVTNSATRMQALLRSRKSRLRFSFKQDLLRLGLEASRREHELLARQQRLANTYSQMAIAIKQFLFNQA